METPKFRTTYKWRDICNTEQEKELHRELWNDMIQYSTDTAQASKSLMPWEKINTSEVLFLPYVSSRLFKQNANARMLVGEIPPPMTLPEEHHRETVRLPGRSVFICFHLVLLWTYCATHSIFMFLFRTRTYGSNSIVVFFIILFWTW